MIKSIIIVGAGQLGSRYLQGLKKINNSLKIFVQDTSIESLNKAKDRWDEINNEECKHQIYFLQDFKNFPKCIDLAIISTPANIRANVVQSLSNLVKVDYWVLEKVLAQNLHEISMIRNSVTKSKGAWVNTSRRMINWHKEIKSNILNSKYYTLCI